MALSQTSPIGINRIDNQKEKEFKDKLNANTLVVENKGHISQDDDVFELQKILDLSNNMLNFK